MLPSDNIMSRHVECVLIGACNVYYYYYDAALPVYT